MTKQRDGIAQLARKAGQASEFPHHYTRARVRVREGAFASG